MNDNYTKLIEQFNTLLNQSDLANFETEEVVLIQKRSISDSNTAKTMDYGFETPQAQCVLRRNP